MELYVNPTKLAYRIVDPLYGDDDLADRLKSRLDAVYETRTSVKLRGAPPQEGTLDKDRMKTLCREMTWLVRDNMAKVVKGPLPSMEDIEELPGEFLLNPGSQIRTDQPRYEKDLEAWTDRLNSIEK